MRQWPKLLILASTAVVLISAHACGGAKPSPTPPPPPPRATPTPINPQALLQESGGVMEDLTSFHFRLEHRTGATPLGAGFVIDEAEGEVVKPDKISARFTGSFGGFAIKSGLINLGDSSYMTNPLTGKWERVPPEVSPLGFFNPSRGIGAIMSQVVQPSLLSAKGDAYRLKGRLPAEALASLLGTTVKGSTVAVEFTLEADGLYLLQAIIDGRVTPTEEDGVVRVITLSRFDEPVDIKAPIP